jgi:hypothetical protein
MLRGWHAHNGVSLGNPRLGFVCTKQTVDGQPGLEGYYLEHDRDLAPDERLRFAPGEEGPDFDPDRAPRLGDAVWPEARRQRVLRNYAMDYVRSILPELVAVLGPAQARHLGAIAGTLIGMQYYAETAALLAVTGSTARDFGAYLTRMAAAQDDTAECAEDGGDVVVRQTTWRLMRGVSPLAPAVFEAWNGLWEGALAVHNRRLRLLVSGRLDMGDGAIEWRIRARPAGGQAEAAAPAPA